jgi:hypothetical protein
MAEQQVTTRRGQYPHIEWIDLYNDGVLQECAVLKKDRSGIYYVRIQDLDSFDKRRMLRIVNKRNADKQALWEVMGETTLGNGMNALAYFHQLVKIKTPGGKIIKPSPYTVGAAQPRSPATGAKRKSIGE